MIKIGEGKTATVYKEGMYAYKKFHPKYGTTFIDYEIKTQNCIFQATTLPVLKYERVNDMIKMPLIDGKSLGERILIEKYNNWLNDFVELQASTYVYKDLALLNAFEVYESQLKQSTLDQTLIDQALVSLHHIPKHTVLCHFDFHPLNIMFANNTYYILDWTNAKLGNPAMDIASTYIIFRHYLKRQANKYLNTILKLTHISKDDVIQALPVMAMMKLMENDDVAFGLLLEGFVRKTDTIFTS